MNNNIYNKIFGPKVGGYNLQESGNYFMDNIIYFHDLVLCVLFFISILVSWFLFTTLLYFGNPILYYNLTNKCIRITAYVFSYIRKILNFIFDKYSLDTLAITQYSAMFKYVTGFNLNEYKSFDSFIKTNDIGYRYYFYSDVKLEFIWTLFPSIVLLLLAIPSFGLLFSVEKVSAPELTVKVIGHQWYWEYQYMDFINFKEKMLIDSKLHIFKNKIEDNYIIESYMINDEDLSKGQFRLLEVDKKLYLPINTSIRLLITSDDVLHSWAVPSLGIKVDACPGRINEIIIKIRDIGIYYGQCSELCGWYHGFMPIVIQSLEIKDFKQWALVNFVDIKYLSETRTSIYKFFEILKNIKDIDKLNELFKNIPIKKNEDSLKYFNPEFMKKFSKLDKVEVNAYISKSIADMKAYLDKNKISVTSPKSLEFPISVENLKSLEAALLLKSPKSLEFPISVKSSDEIFFNKMPYRFVYDPVMGKINIINYKNIEFKELKLTNDELYFFQTILPELMEKYKLNKHGIDSFLQNNAKFKIDAFQGLDLDKMKKESSIVEKIVYSNAEPFKLENSKKLPKDHFNDYWKILKNKNNNNNEIKL